MLIGVIYNKPFIYLFTYLVTVSYVAHAVLKLEILLSPPPECWDCCTKRF
jgi:hypothetical protein